MNKLKNLIVNYLIKNVLKGNVEDDIFAFGDNGKVYFKNKEIERNESLVNEAKYIISSSVWKQLSKELKHNANNRMYLSKCENDLLFSKAMIYNLDLLNELLSKLSNTRFN